MTHRKKKAKPVVVEPEKTQPGGRQQRARGRSIAFSTHSGAKSRPPRRIQMPSTWARTQMATSGSGPAGVVGQQQPDLPERPLDEEEHAERPRDVAAIVRGIHGIHEYAGRAPHVLGRAHREFAAPNLSAERTIRPTPG